MSGLMATYEWGQLPWRKLEVAVFKLQKRIYKASQAGDTRRVHQLQQGRCKACGLVFTPQALIEIHHLDGDHRNNRYGNLAAVHRHCHDQIHGGYHELSQRVGTHDKSPVN